MDSDLSSSSNDSLSTRQSRQRANKLNRKRPGIKRQRQSYAQATQVIAKRHPTTLKSPEEVSEITPSESTWLVGHEVQKEVVSIRCKRLQMQANIQDYQSAQETLNATMQTLKSDTEEIKGNLVLRWRCSEPCTQDYPP